MVTIKSLSIPDTNKIPASGGTFVIKGATGIDLSLTDPFQSGPKDSIWNLASDNISVVQEPYSVVSNLNSQASFFTLTSKNEFSVNNFAFNFKAYSNIVSSNGYFEFYSYAKMYGVSKSIEIRNYSRTSGSKKSVDVYLDNVLAFSQDVNDAFLNLYFFYSEGAFQVCLNEIDNVIFQSHFTLPNSYELEIGAKSEQGFDGSFSFKPERFSILPMITGVPTMDSVKFLKVSSFKLGEFSFRVEPGAPGFYDLKVHPNSIDHIGSQIDSVEIEVISKLDGEDSLKFLSSSVSKFYDDFNRISVCPSRGVPFITNKSKSSILFNRCICDGSSDTSKLTLDVNLGGRANISNRGLNSPSYKYVDADGVVYGNNFNAERILLPRPEFEQDFPINDLRMLELSDGRLLYYGVKSEPLVNNERTINFRIEILPTHDEDYEPGETFGFENWSLLDLNDNTVKEERFFDTQSDIVQRTLVLKEGRYALRAYDANVTIRLDSNSGPILDKEEDIQARFEYNYDFYSNEFSVDLDEEFEYMARDKFVEFVFDVKRYNGTFVGYIYDPCDGRVEVISSIYDDVNLTTNSYSVVENDFGELIFFYINIDGEKVYESRTDSLSFRKIDLLSNTLSDERFGVAFNRDAERIISSRPNVSLITGSTSIPSWLTPITINFSIRDYFIYSFDLCYDGDNVKCYVSWGTSSNKDSRPYHRMYNMEPRGPLIEGESPDGALFSYIFRESLDRNASVNYYYSQSPSIESSLEIYFLNFILGRDIDGIRTIWQRGFSNANLIKKYDLISYENAYNYSRNFINNSYENLDRRTVINITEDSDLYLSILNKSYKLFMKSIGPSYVRAKFDKENNKVLISMLDFSRKLPLTIIDEGIMYDLCSPLHFSSIDFVRDFKGVIMDSYSACFGADGFVYSVATSNNLKNSFEIGISGGSIMNDSSNLYIYESASKVLDNPKYSIIGDSAYYLEDFSTITIPMMNSYKRYNGFKGADLTRHNGYLMISSGGSSRCLSAFVLEGQDAYPISNNCLQSFMPDLDKVNPSSLIVSGNVLNNGYEFIADNGNYGPAPFALNLNVSPTQRNMLDKGYRFKFRVESLKEDFLDPFVFIFFLSAGTTGGVQFKVKYYGSRLELYRVQGSNDFLLDSIEDLPSGIIDIYVFAKKFSEGTCKLSLLVKQSEYLKLFKRDLKDHYNFKNRFYKIISSDVPLSAFTGGILTARFENSLGQPNDDSISIREIDWGTLETNQGFYSYTGTDSLFSQDFLPNSNKIIRTFDDFQLFSEGSIPDHSFKVVQTSIGDGFCYERHFPYGFVMKFMASSLSLSDRWSLSRDELMSRSLDPFNVHTVWTSDNDESGGRIWADAIDSNLDSFPADTFIVEGVNVKSLNLIGRNSPSEPWGVFSNIDMLRNVIEIDRVQRTDKGYLIQCKADVLDISHDEQCYLYQDNFEPAIISSFHDGSIYIYTDKNIPYYEGLAKIYSNKGSKIIDEPVKYRQIGIQMPNQVTAEGYFKIASLAFGKYNDIPILYNNDLGSGVKYSLSVENFYAFDNQPFFKYDKIMVKEYNLTYSLFDSLSYAKFRSIVNEASVSRKPVWIIDRYLVNPREFSLALNVGQSQATVIKDNSSEVIYNVSMNFRSIK
jgi:hypothetical protein